MLLQFSENHFCRPLTSFVENLVPDGGGLFRQVKAPCTKIGYFEERSNNFKGPTWPSSSRDISVIQDVGDVLDKEVESTEVPPSNLQDLRKRTVLK